MVVLAGYKTVKQALVQHADVFGHRDPILIMQEFNKGHGKHRRTFCFFGLVCEQTCNCAEVSQLLRPPAGGVLLELLQLSRGGVHPEKVASLSEGTVSVYVSESDQYPFNH